jgi:hypothetical protein
MENNLKKTIVNLSTTASIIRQSQIELFLDISKSLKENKANIFKKLEDSEFDFKLNRYHQSFVDDSIITAISLYEEKTGNFVDKITRFSETDLLRSVVGGHRLFCRVLFTISCCPNMKIVKIEDKIEDKIEIVKEENKEETEEIEEPKEKIKQKFPNFYFFSDKCTSKDCFAFLRNETGISKPRLFYSDREKTKIMTEEKYPLCENLNAVNDVVLLFYEDEETSYL